MESPISTREPRTTTDAAKRPLRPDDGRLARGRRSRARIRAAARELFRERGFDRATLREIAARAGMGTSSIYRHVETKEELLVMELAELQEEAWLRFRSEEGRHAACRERLRAFFGVQHELLAQETDFTRIALRALTFDNERVTRRVLGLDDRSIGLLTEILLAGRMRGELRREADVLAAARALFHVAIGARLSWANGVIDEPTCREVIESGVDLLFDGLKPAR